VRVATAQTQAHKRLTRTAARDTVPGYALWLVSVLGTDLSDLSGLSDCPSAKRASPPHRLATNGYANSFKKPRDSRVHRKQQTFRE